MEREDHTTVQPVPSQCPVALSTLGWHLLGLTKLLQPLGDVTARYALPCLPGPGALAGITAMKETENVFICQTKQSPALRRSQGPGTAALDSVLQIPTPSFRSTHSPKPHRE